MSNATATAVRFTAVRIDGRWKVQDGVDDSTKTCASRAAAEERAATLNAAEERAGTTLQERSGAVPEIATRRGRGGRTEYRAYPQGVNHPDGGSGAWYATREQAETVLAFATDTMPEYVAGTTEPTTLAEVRAEMLPSVDVDDAEVLDAMEAAGITAPLAVVTMDGADATVDAEPTRVPLGTVPTRRPAKKAAAKKAPAVAGETMKSLWVAAAFVPIILADTTPERASLVAKVDASIPNNRGGRTVRLTRTEATELAAIGTEIETAAIEEGGKAAGRMAHSAVTMRARLAALWA